MGSTVSFDAAEISAWTASSGLPNRR